MARVCCDSRRIVRTTALTVLQRSLLLHDMQDLDAAGWEECFYRVLFPLLSSLVDDVTQDEGVAFEEIRMRALTLVCKV